MSWKENLSRFVCQRCGNCCKGDGYVWLTEKDIRRLSKHLELKRAKFLKTLTRLAEGEIALLDRAGPEKPCIFYEEDLGCRVYDARPKQCRDFPVKWHDDDSILYCRGLQAIDAD